MASQYLPIFQRLTLAPYLPHRLTGTGAWPWSNGPIQVDADMLGHDLSQC